MSGLPVDRKDFTGSPIETQRVCDVIAGFPDAEDVLEQAGVDYWFGGDEILGVACKDAHADPAEVVSRIAACCPCARGDSPSATLAALLRESDEQWRQRLAPAIETALTTARIRSHPAASGPLRELKKRLEHHMATSHSLLPAAEAIGRGEAGVFDPTTLRALRLEHLDLARLVRDLRAYAEASGANDADLADVLRGVIHEVHHHLMMAYNIILPQLVTAAAGRPVAYEPW